MRFIEKYLQQAASLIKAYKGDEPLHHFLKKYFSENKKHGSKDRKAIAHFCYSYYRLGHALKEISIEECVTISLFLSENATQWQQLYKEDFLQQINSDVKERISFIQQKYPVVIEGIFPFMRHLSEGVDKEQFALSHLIQPKLFIRLRPQKKTTAIKKLEASQLAYEVLDDHCIAFENTTRIDDVLVLNEEYVVQDYNSQKVGDFLNDLKLPAKASVWDCCAASGGKSIMAYDLLPKIKLTVSDIRQSILQNLNKRFNDAGIKNYKSLVIDSTNAPALQSALENQQFDLIICDAPCSGSGTWGRTPEQLYFFNEEEINRYSKLQKQITSNITSYLKVGGYLLYITCSVFKEENEDVVGVLQKLGLKLERINLLEGYTLKADTMFAALLVKD